MRRKKNRAHCLDVEWVGHPKCSTCSVRHTVLFAELGEAEFNGLLQPVNQYLFHSRSALYEQGGTDQFLFSIRSGVVLLRQTLPNGATRVVRLLHAGDVIGLEVLLGESYHHTAIALTDVDACRIHAKVVHDLDEHTSHLRRQLMNRWQHHLTMADEFIVQLSTGSSTARLARLLLMLRRMEESFITLNREDIGSMLGVTTETASRLMAEFKRNGWVQESHGRCIGCDATQLERVALDLG